MKINAGMGKWRGRSKRFKNRERDREREGLFEKRNVCVGPF